MWFSLIGASASSSTISKNDWNLRPQEQLVAALVDGDRQAFDWIVRKHWSGMMRVATGVLGNESIAVEVVQETWEAVVKEIKRFRGEASLSTWIFRILINRARRVGKREGRSIPFSSFKTTQDEDGKRSLEDEFTSKGRWRSPVHGWRMIDPQTEAINKQGLAFLAKGLEELPDRQKIIVTLRDIEGLEAKEVCRMLDISEGNQRILLHRGRTRLRRMLEDLDGHGHVSQQKDSSHAQLSRRR